MEGLLADAHLVANLGHRGALLRLAQAKGDLLRGVSELLHGKILLTRKFRSSHNTRILTGPVFGEQITWCVPNSLKVGYEISFALHFYESQPLRPLKEIRADILALEGETDGLLMEIIR